MGLLGWGPIILYFNGDKIVIKWLGFLVVFIYCQMPISWNPSAGGSESELQSLGLSRRRRKMATPARALTQKEQDIQMMLAAEVHLGTKNCNFQMERYVFKRRNDGMCLFISLTLRFSALCNFLSGFSHCGSGCAFLVVFWMRDLKHLAICCVTFASVWVLKGVLSNFC